METCIGCGEKAKQHPIFAVGKEQPKVGFFARLRGETPEAEIGAFPVCEPCWREPSHRKRTLKFHFFLRHEVARAVAATKLLDEKSKRGEDLTL